MALARIESDIARGVWVDPSKAALQTEQRREQDAKEAITVAQWAEIYLRMKERESKTSTHRTISARVHNHIVPVLGNKRLIDVTRADIEQWYDGLTVKREAPYQTVRAMFLAAVESDRTALVTSPVKIKGAGKSEQRECRYLASDDEIQRLMEFTPESMQAFICLGYDGGLRVNEALALRRKDVAITRDNHGKVTDVRIRVERTLTRAATGSENTGSIEGTTKSEAGKRTVILMPSSWPVMTDHLDNFVANDPEAILFPSKSDPNRYWRDDRASIEFKAIAASAGIQVPKGKEFTYHALRHYSATKYGLAGAPLAALMARYGWSDVKSAMRYQHADMDMQELFVSRMQTQRNDTELANVVSIDSKRKVN
ncbi:tyrosine-type recombinase/integrase [Actinomyces vulturis]|uniref:tyrosine-type recombinase/integrase n=1 Tax=Actinomyces vulturis TaxID=1857645 RepID=UPI000829B208|nr:site-specific integrase [Actinomyces vulturis]